MTIVTLSIEDKQMHASILNIVKFRFFMKKKLYTRMRLMNYADHYFLYRH